MKLINVDIEIELLEKRIMPESTAGFLE